MSSNITTSVRYWRLEFRKDGSDKFYEVWLSEVDAEVWLSWGRIGSSGQSDRKEFATSADAVSKALAQVYAKESKGYTIVHGDLTFTVDHEIWDTNIYRLRHLTQQAVRSGDATPREAALNYIEGFITDCNEFLMNSKGGWNPADLASSFEDLSMRWEELKDKFDSAETMMHMVKMRALKRA